MTRLFEEMTPSPTAPGAYILIVSYAGFTGEGELLENLYKRGLKGKRIYKSLECVIGRRGFSCFGVTSGASLGNSESRDVRIMRSKREFSDRIPLRDCTATNGCRAKRFHSSRTMGRVR
jgi:hypothetical protein